MVDPNTAFGVSGLTVHEQRGRALLLQHAQSVARKEQRDKEASTTRKTESIPSVARHRFPAEPSQAVSESTVPEQFRRLWERASQEDREAIVWFIVQGDGSSVG